MHKEWRYGWRAYGNWAADSSFALIPTGEMNDCSNGCMGGAFKLLHFLLVGLDDSFSLSSHRIYVKPGLSVYIELNSLSQYHPLPSSFWNPQNLNFKFKNLKILQYKKFKFTRNSVIKNNLIYFLRDFHHVFFLWEIDQMCWNQNPKLNVCAKKTKITISKKIK